MRQTTEPALPTSNSAPPSRLLGSPRELTMCLVLLAYQCHPQYPLVVAANRDEFHRRPAQAARFWPEQQTLLAGRDLEAGGTWMGLSRNGRFAVVTNYREPDPQINGVSRGGLCRDFLVSGATPNDFITKLQPLADQYNGFNLLLWDSTQLINYCNREQIARVLSPGIYGMSNGLLNENWPKVFTGRQALARALTGQFSVTRCLQLLADRTPPADNMLPDTGVGLALEQLLAPRFICSERYGTRVSSVAWQHRDGNMGLTERRFNNNGDAQGQVRFDFSTTVAADGH